MNPALDITAPLAEHPPGLVRRCLRGAAFAGCVAILAVLAVPCWAVFALLRLVSRLTSPTTFRLP
jgi:hypothetical protein